MRRFKFALTGVHLHNVLERRLEHPHLVGGGRDRRHINAGPSARAGQHGGHRAHQPPKDTPLVVRKVGSTSQLLDGCEQALEHLLAYRQDVCSDLPF
jgi:hypothetical protein